MKDETTTTKEATPQQQREKALRTALEGVLRIATRENFIVNPSYVAMGCKRVAEAGLERADAIPDAPVCPMCKDNNPALACSNGFHAPKPAPSRADLIELMCNTLAGGGWSAGEDNRFIRDMGRVLDALIKAGAVRP